jgi:chromosome segregation ATPase
MPQNKSAASSGPAPELSANDRQQLAEEFKSRIHDQKTAISELQSEITRVSSSIQYVGGNCVSGCVEWNEHQQQKQQAVDRMKSQLEEAQHRLDELQDSAHKQGFGSAVSDPE